VDGKLLLVTTIWLKSFIDWLIGLILINYHTHDLIHMIKHGYRCFISYIVTSVNQTFVPNFVNGYQLTYYSNILAK